MSGDDRFDSVWLKTNLNGLLTIDGQHMGLAMGFEKLTQVAVRAIDGIASHRAGLDTGIKSPSQHGLGLLWLGLKGVICGYVSSLTTCRGIAASSWPIQFAVDQGMAVTTRIGQKQDLG